jgi:hypothetical protein
MNTLLAIFFVQGIQLHVQILVKRGNPGIAYYHGVNFFGLFTKLKSLVYFIL